MTTTEVGFSKQDFIRAEMELADLQAGIGTLEIAPEAPELPVQHTMAEELPTIEAPAEETVRTLGSTATKKLTLPARVEVDTPEPSASLVNYRSRPQTRTSEEILADARARWSGTGAAYEANMRDAAQRRAARVRGGYENHNVVAQLTGQYPRDFWAPNRQ